MGDVEELDSTITQLLSRPPPFAGKGTIRKSHVVPQLVHFGWIYVKSQRKRPLVANSMDFLELWVVRMDMERGILATACSTLDDGLLN